METNRPSGKPQSRGGRGRIEKEESFETIKGSSVQEFIPAAHKAIEQQRTTRTKTSNIERVLLSRSAAKYKKSDAKKRKNAAKWRGNSLNTDSRISRYKETTSPCKVLIRNIPPSVSFDEMREILTPYDISDKMIWRYVMGKTRMNERPCTTGRMYLDFRSDTAKAVDFIASLNGYAIECTQKGLNWKNSRIAYHISSFVVDSKRNLEVAYAPSRRLPGDRKRRDTNAEEIFQDQSYLDFIEALNAPAQVGTALTFRMFKISLVECAETERRFDIARSRTDRAADPSACSVLKRKERKRTSKETNASIPSPLSFVLFSLVKGTILTKRNPPPNISASTKYVHAP